MNGIGIFSEKFIIKQLNVWNFAYISRIGKFDGIRTSKYRYEQSFCADYDCAAGLKKKSAFRYQKDIRSWRTIRTREPCRHHCFSMGLLVGRRGGRRGTLTLGKFPLMTLAEARDARFAAKKDVAAGTDPCRKKLTLRRCAANSGTFHPWWTS